MHVPSGGRCRRVVRTFGLKPRNVVVVVFRHRLWQNYFASLENLRDTTPTQSSEMSLSAAARKSGNAALVFGSDSMNKQEKVNTLGISKQI